MCCGIETNKLSGGSDNHGVWVHHYNNTKIVEKRSSNNLEQNVLNFIDFSKSKPSIVIDVITTYKLNDIIIYFMAFLENAGNTPCLNKVNADLIAKSIVEFENFLCHISSLHSMETLSCSYSDTIFKSFYSKSNLSKSQITQLSHIQKLLSKNLCGIPKNHFVPCHGDLYFPNMSIESDSDGIIKDIKIFDYGLCAKRPIGYEFHHFIRHSINDKNLFEFTLHLICKYSEIKRYDKAIIYQNAIISSLSRSLLRSYSHIKNKNEKAFFYELNALFMLFNLLKSEVSN